MPDNIKASYSISPIVTRVTTSGRRNQYQEERRRYRKKDKKLDTKKTMKTLKLGKHIDIRI